MLPYRAEQNRNSLIKFWKGFSNTVDCNKFLFSFSFEGEFQEVPAIMFITLYETVIVLTVLTVTFWQCYSYCTWSICFCFSGSILFLSSITVKWQPFSDITDILEWKKLGHALLSARSKHIGTHTHMHVTKRGISIIMKQYRLLLIEKLCLINSSSAS